MNLTNDVAIVTGGAQGIGGATARRLAEAGARVLIVDVDGPAAERNATRIRDAGGEAAVLVADVAQPDTPRAMAAEAVGRFGKLTILVSNAYNVTSAEQRGSALEVTERGWEEGLDILARSIFLGAKNAAPEMRKAGRGAIVNIASVHGMFMAPGYLVYEAGKAAVIGMTRQMACDFGPLGVRVNAICPGHIVTERVQAHVWDKNPDGLRFFEQQYPVRRTGRPEDIANAVAFLCSEEASFITGHALVVDGGLTIQLQENLGVHLAKWARAHPEVPIRD